MGNAPDASPGLKDRERNDAAVRAAMAAALEADDERVAILDAPGEDELDRDVLGFVVAAMQLTNICRDVREDWDDGRHTERVSTALLCADPEAAHGVRWHSVHETWAAGAGPADINGRNASSGP